MEGIQLCRYSILQVFDSAGIHLHFEGISTEDRKTTGLLTTGLLTTGHVTTGLLDNWSFGQLVFLTTGLLDNWFFRQLVFWTTGLLPNWSRRPVPKRPVV